MTATDRSQKRSRTVLLAPQLSTNLPSSRTALVIIGGALLALALGVMDQSIVATAGPTIISDLGGLSLYAWVFTAFILAQTVSMPILGKLSDIYGRKRFFLAGLIIFIAGSILSGVSQNIQELIAFRAVQGLGSGAFFSIGLAIIGSSVKPEQRARVLGISGSVFGSGAIFGPTVGSYLVQSAGWRWIFYVNLPVGLASLILVSFWLKETRGPQAKRAVDWLGVASLTGWVSFLLLGLLNGGATYPWYSWQEALFFGAFIVLLPFFLLVEARAKEPILPLTLFKNRTISASFVVQLIRGAVLLSLVVFVALFVQAGLGGTIDDVRNVIYAFVVPFIAGSILGGRVVTRLGYRLVTLSGLVVIMIGALLRVLIGVSPSLFEVAATSIPFGLGLGISIASVLSAFQNSVDRKQIGVASSLSTFSQNLGGAVGVAILGSIQLNSLATRLNTVVQQAPPSYQAQLSQFLGNTDQVGFVLTSPGFTHSALSVFLPQIRIALAGSILDVFVGLFVMSIVAVVASSFITGSRWEAVARVQRVTGGTSLRIGRTASVIISIQFLIIGGLLAALSSEYQSNVFMQQWISGNAEPLAFFLNNYISPILLGVVGIAVLGLRLIQHRAKSSS